jgi:hypothetical protein
MSKSKFISWCYRLTPFFDARLQCYIINVLCSLWSEQRRLKTNRAQQFYEAIWKCAVL